MRMQTGAEPMTSVSSDRELTLFWSKLLKRLEPSEAAFLARCRQMSLLSKTVYHILFLIKVIQSEVSKPSAVIKLSTQ